MIDVSAQHSNSIACFDSCFLHSNFTITYIYIHSMRYTKTQRWVPTYLASFPLAPISPISPLARSLLLLYLCKLSLFLLLLHTLQLLPAAAHPTRSCWRKVSRIRCTMSGSVCRHRLLRRHRAAPSCSSPQPPPLPACRDSMCTPLGTCNAVTHAEHMTHDTCYTLHIINK